VLPQKIRTFLRASHLPLIATGAVGHGGQDDGCRVVNSAARTARKLFEQLGRAGLLQSSVDPFS
jgi:hypothetical protein